MFEADGTSPSVIVLVSVVVVVSFASIFLGMAAALAALLLSTAAAMAADVAVTSMLVDPVCPTTPKPTCVRIFYSASDDSCVGFPA